MSTTVSSSTVTPPRAGASRGAAAGSGNWRASLRNAGPITLIGVILIALWYALGIYNNVPFARQILGPKASTGDVFRSALNLPMPWVPLPHQVLSDFFDALAQPLDSPRGLWIHIGATGLEMGLGVLCGGLFGILIATLFIHSRPLETAFLPYVVASQTIPVIALAPIVIGIFGITLAAKVLVSAYLAFFSVAVSTTKGFKSTEPLARELMRSYAANPWQVYWKLRFPTALPYLFAGLKVAVTASLVGAIIAELPFGSPTGLGARLLVATTYNETIAWWSTMLAGAILGLVGYSIVAGLERLLVKRRDAAGSGG